MPRPFRAPASRRLHREFLATTALALGLGIGLCDRASAQSYSAGANATAAGANATAIGPNASAAGDHATALGEDASAVGPYSFAQGFGARAMGNSTTSGGLQAGAIAIGLNAFAGPNGGGTTLAIGSSARATTPTGTGDSLAFGTEAQATGQDSLAIGAQTTASGLNTIAIGNNGTANAGAESTVIGVGSTASSAATNSVVLGNGSAATAAGTTVLGQGASASQAGGVALGFESIALRGALNGASEAFSGTAVGSTLGAVSVGSAGNERQITNVAGGTENTDAVNVRQLRSLGNTLGNTLGGGFDSTTNAYTPPSYAYGGQNYATVPALANALDTFALRYDRDGSGNPLASVDLTRGNRIGNGSGVSITGLAPATTDSGAVALSQMPLRYSTAASPTTANPAVPSNDVTLVGSAAGPVALHNVAAGDASSGSSTDAVNGGQLYATNQNVAALQNGTAGLVRQANGTAPITVGQSTGGTVVDLTNAQNGTRRLAGLSAGIADSDAATLGQLRLSSNALGGGAGYDTSTGAFTAPSYAVGGQTYHDVGSALAAANALGVQYVADGAGNPTAVVDLAKGGATPVALHGVAAGRLASGSTDAVNGDQLNTTNQEVAALQNGTSGLVQQASGSSPITVGAASGGTRVDFTNNTGNARMLTGVAGGTLAPGSTDAVNGSQLYAVSQSVASNYNAVANGTVGLVQQDPASRTITVGATTDGRLVDLTGSAGTRRLAGLSAGIADTDAATVGQMRFGNGFVTSSLGGGAAYDPTTGAFTAPSYAVGGQTYRDVGSALAATNALGVQYVADGAGNPTAVVDLAKGGATPIALRGVAAGAVAANSTDGVNGGQLYAVSQGVAALQSGNAGLVRQDATTRAISVGGTTDGTTIGFADQSGAARTLTGIAAGRIAAGSTQGVNAGQVYAVTASLAGALGGGAGVAADGTLTAPSYAIQGSTYSTVGGALGSLDAAVASLNTNGSRYVAVRSTGAAAQASGLDTVAIGPAAIAGADRGVALGAGAVASRAGLSGASEAFSGTSVASTQGAVSVGDVGAERQITNVAGGTQDTDAVNLRQLRAVGGNLAGALGGGAGFAADGSFTAPSYAIGGRQYASVGAALGAVDAYGVKYDVDPASGGRGQSITLAGGDPSQPVLIRRVAAGILPTDAANVGQVTQARSDAYAYTDRSIAASSAAGTAYTDAAVAPLQSQMSAFGNQLSDLTRQVGEVRSEARRGAAVGLAAASLRFDDRPGKISLAAGGGVWRGEAAASFGVGYTLPDGWAKINATGVAAGRDFGIGAGASFTLN